MLAHAKSAPAGSPELPPALEGGAAGADRASHAERFEHIFRQFAPYVRRILPRMGIAPGEVDDVLQEVFLAVHRGLPGFERRSSEKTWVYGICIRVCKNHRQRAHRRYELSVASPPDAGDPCDPERTVGARRALRRLDSALWVLPEAQRAVFVLYEIEALAISEIAEALACSKFTIYARLYAARRAVTRALDGPATEESDDA